MLWWCLLDVLLLDFGASSLDLLLVVLDETPPLLEVTSIEVVLVILGGRFLLGDVADLKLDFDEDFREILLTLFFCY